MLCLRCGPKREKGTTHKHFDPPSAKYNTYFFINLLTYGPRVSPTPCPNGFCNANYWRTLHRPGAEGLIISFTPLGGQSSKSSPWTRKGGCRELEAKESSLQRKQCTMGTARLVPPLANCFEVIWILYTCTGMRMSLYMDMSERTLACLSHQR